MSSFSGPVQVEWLSDGRDMKLLRGLSFIDDANKYWLAKADSVINGASIPKMLWSLIGSPFVGKYRRASVLHDVHCHIKINHWQDVHMMFHEAMLADGVDHGLADLMFQAVYLFGPRWDSKGKELKLEKSHRMPWEGKENLVSLIKAHGDLA